MAYMSQEKKKQLAPAIKAVLQKHGMKGSISVRNHMSLCVKVTKGKIDFGTARTQVNHYWLDKNWSGDARVFLTELKTAMMAGNHDNSDIMTDYFDVGWYVDIEIGSYNKPYEIV